MISAYTIALLATVGLAPQHRTAVADAIYRARASVGRLAPTEENAAAIIEHESHGNPTLCVDEPDGSSSRGLMQLNHKDAHCDAEGDKKYGREYDAATNVWLGIRLLGKQLKWHRQHCNHPHDPLEHYAGTGPKAKEFARYVRRRSRELRAQLKGKH